MASFEKTLSCINLLLIFSLFVSASVLSACREEAANTAQFVPKDVYHIEVGGMALVIPSPYLSHAENYRDGVHRSVMVSGILPGMEPLPDRDFNEDIPYRPENGFRFTIQAIEKDHYFTDSLLRHWAKSGSFEVPEKWTHDGLVHIGQYHVAGQLETEVYALVSDNQVIAQIKCTVEDRVIKKTCNFWQTYRENKAIISFLHLDIEHLNWYSGGGWQNFRDLVDEWRVE